MKRNFEWFVATLQKTNQTLDSFCDFAKIVRNVEGVRLSLCQLNSLIGSVDLRVSVAILWERDPKAFEALDILLAVRDGHDKLVLNNIGQCVTLGSYYKSVDGVIEFLRETGLERLFVERKVNNLIDYVFGVETGLDTNARKNRVGHLMERLIAERLISEGIVYRQEVFSSEWLELSQALGSDKKRFDFVVETATKIYLIEVNFYNSSGSKLNEVARSYSEIAPRINALEGFEFVWITDGPGWLQAKNKLEEAYQIIPKIYNLHNVSDFLTLIKA